MAAQLPELEQNLKHLQREVRGVSGAVKRARQTHSARASPSLHIRRIAAIVHLLCGCAELAAIWASRATRKRRGLLQNPAERTSAQTVLEWSQELREDVEVTAALQGFAHNMREQADDFLIETLVIEDLLKYWSQGIQTSTEIAIIAFIRKWRMRPRSAGKYMLLQRLAEDVEYRKSWGRYFRARWNLRWAAGGCCRHLTSTCIQAKAAVFIRWIRWARHSRGADRPCVIINMDETAVTCLKTTKLGMVGPNKFECAMAGFESKKQRGFPRCALIAAIGNDNDLQSKLPQVFLPKSKPGVYPPENIRRVFSDARPPTQAYHGGSGYQNAESMHQWLKDLRCVLKRHRPNHVWILVMDCYSVHVSLIILRYALSLGFAVVLIPGRMTWLLQPLDTHVFAEFKNLLRRLIMNLRTASKDGTIAWKDALQAAIQATHAKLVTKSWLRVMQAAGMDVDTSALRPALRNVLGDADLHPRPPTQEEMRTVLGTQGQHAEEVRRLLTRPGKSPAGSSASGSVTSKTAVPSEHDAVVDGPTRAAAGSGAAGPVPCSAHPSHADTTSRRFPVGRRLWMPQPRNLLMPAPRPRREGPSAGTRSQKRPCHTGVVQAEAQSRSLKIARSLSSLL